MLKNWKWILALTVVCIVGVVLLAPDLWAGVVAVCSGLATLLFRRATARGNQTASELAREAEIASDEGPERLRQGTLVAEERGKELERRLDEDTEASGRAIEALRRGADVASNGSGSGKD